MRVLVIYATIEGHSRTIASRIERHLRQSGHPVDLVDAAQPPVSISVDKTHAVIVVGPVHAGHYPAPLRRYIREHARELMARPGAFVSVSLTAVSDDPAERAELDPIVEEFSNETGWWPISVHHAAGALKYTEYDYFRRWILKRISASQGGPTDTTRDYEFTDWNALESFCVRFVREAPVIAGKV